MTPQEIKATLLPIIADYQYKFDAREKKLAKAVIRCQADLFEHYKLHYLDKLLILLTELLTPPTQPHEALSPEVVRDALAKFQKDFKLTGLSYLADPENDGNQLCKACLQALRFEFNSSYDALRFLFPEVTNQLEIGFEATSVPKKNNPYLSRQHYTMRYTPQSLAAETLQRPDGSGEFYAVTELCVSDYTLFVIPYVSMPSLTAFHKVKTKLHDECPKLYERFRTHNQSFAQRCQVDDEKYGQPSVKEVLSALRDTLRSYSDYTNGDGGSLTPKRALKITQAIATFRNFLARFAQTQPHSQQHQILALTSNDAHSSLSLEQLLHSLEDPHQTPCIAQASDTLTNILANYANKTVLALEPPLTTTTHGSEIDTFDEYHCDPLLQSQPDQEFLITVARRINIPLDIEAVGEQLQYFASQAVYDAILTHNKPICDFLYRASNIATVLLFLTPENRKHLFISLIAQRPDCLDFKSLGYFDRTKCYKLLAKILPSECWELYVNQLTERNSDGYARLWKMVDAGLPFEGFSDTLRKSLVDKQSDKALIKAIRETYSHKTAALILSALPAEKQQQIFNGLASKPRYWYHTSSAENLIKRIYSTDDLCELINNLPRDLLAQVWREQGERLSRHFVWTIGYSSSFFANFMNSIEGHPEQRQSFLQQLQKSRYFQLFDSPRDFSKILSALSPQEATNTLLWVHNAKNPSPCRLDDVTTLAFVIARCSPEIVQQYVENVFAKSSSRESSPPPTFQLNKGDVAALFSKLYHLRLSQPEKHHILSYLASEQAQTTLGFNWKTVSLSSTTLLHSLCIASLKERQAIFAVLDKRENFWASIVTSSCMAPIAVGDLLVHLNKQQRQIVFGKLATASSVQTIETTAQDKATSEGSSTKEDASKNALLPLPFSAPPMPQPHEASNLSIAANSPLNKAVTHLKTYRQQNPSNSTNDLLKLHQAWHHLLRYCSLEQRQALLALAPNFDALLVTGQVPAEKKPSNKPKVHLKRLIYWQLEACLGEKFSAYFALHLLLGNTPVSQDASASVSSPLIVASLLTDDAQTALSDPQNKRLFNTLSSLMDIDASDNTPPHQTAVWRDPLFSATLRKNLSGPSKRPLSATAFGQLQQLKWLEDNASILFTQPNLWKNTFLQTPVQTTSDNFHTYLKTCFDTVKTAHQTRYGASALVKQVGIFNDQAMSVLVQLPILNVTVGTVLIVMMLVISLAILIVGSPIAALVGKFKKQTDLRICDKALALSNDETVSEASSPATEAVLCAEQLADTAASTPADSDSLQAAETTNEQDTESVDENTQSSKQPERKSILIYGLKQAAQHTFWTSVKHPQQKQRLSALTPPPVVTNPPRPSATDPEQLPQQSRYAAPGALTTQG